jgi:hypothetical protein
VVETVVRVPGGDAVHRAYGVRSPREVGDEWVVAEIENRTAVPFAVGPGDPALRGRRRRARVRGDHGTGRGRPGRDVAHLVRVDGRPAVVLPRRPARLAVGDDESGDVVARR